MSVWDDIKKPFDEAVNSTPFKVAFPVQALAQGATKLATGLDPSEQYAAGAAGGSLIAGGAALMGSGSATPSTTPSSGASAWENHASPMRYVPQMLGGGQRQQQQASQPQMSMPPFPTLQNSFATSPLEGPAKEE